MQNNIPYIVDVQVVKCSSCGKEFGLSLETVESVIKRLPPVELMHGAGLYFLKIEAVCERCMKDYHFHYQTKVLAEMAEVADELKKLTADGAVLE